MQFAHGKGGWKIRLEERNIKKCQLIELQKGVKNKKHQNAGKIRATSH